MAEAMIVKPNRVQWRVIWVVTSLVLGLWIVSAPWSDLGVSTIAEQRRVHDAGAKDREARWREEKRSMDLQSANRSYSSGAIGEMQRRWDEDDDRQREATARARLNHHRPDFRGDAARTDIRNRVIVAALVVGLLLVWRFAKPATVPRGGGKDANTTSEGPL
jgi:hypothetical protein